MTDPLETKLLALIAAVPAGDKLPLGRFGRELDASQSVIVGLIEALIADGRIDRQTLRSPAAPILLGGTDFKAPSIVDRRNVGGGGGIGMPEPPVAGRALFDLLVAEAHRRGVTAQAASRAIFDNKARIYSLRDATSVRAVTLAKVRAWLGAKSDRGDGCATPPPGTGASAALDSGAGAGCSVDPPVPAIPASRDVSMAILNDHPTGEQLVAAVRKAAALRNMPLTAFLRPITGSAAVWVEQTERVARPKQLTVDRISALIAGQPIPPRTRRLAHPNQMVRRVDREAAGLPPSKREIEEVRKAAADADRRNEEDGRRDAATRAQSSRSPGETLTAAVAREAGETCGDREDSTIDWRSSRTFSPTRAARGVETPADRLRRLSGEVDDESLGDLRAVRQRQAERDCATPSALIRRAMRDWPGLCGRVARLAVEMGVSKAEAWRRALSAGIECLEEGETT